jgi:hypothetical protein
MEPERRIEKLVRAFAKKRREQAGDPMELHSARRQQLQKEIARRSAVKGGGWFSNFFFGLRPRLVFAVCFSALAITALILWPRLNHPKPGASLASAKDSRDEIAQTKKTPAALTPPPVSIMTPPVATADEDGLQDKQKSVPATQELKQQEPTIAAGNRAVLPEENSTRTDVVTNSIAQFDTSTGVSVASGAPSNNETPAFKSNGGFGGGGVGAVSKNATDQFLSQPAAPTGATFAANADSVKNLKMRAAPVAPPPPASAQFRDQRKTEIAAAEPPASRLFLNQLDLPVTRQRPTESLSAPAPVLASFRVEQSGNTMRVIDADGSVYTGAVQVAQQESPVRAVSPKNAPSAVPRAQVAGQVQAAQNYSFRVAGTNRNLQQNVVFSGNLIPLTNASVSGIGGFGGASAAQSQLSAEIQLSNSRISGRAVVGNQKAIEVDATPAP